MVRWEANEVGAKTHFSPDGRGDDWRRRVGIEPTRDGFPPHNGFEVRGRHQTTFASVKPCKRRFSARSSAPALYRPPSSKSMRFFVSRKPRPATSAISGRHDEKTGSHAFFSSASPFLPIRRYALADKGPPPERAMTVWRKRIYAPRDGSSASRLFSSLC